MRHIFSGVAIFLIAATCQAVTIYVDDNALNDPGPNNPNISDPCENGSDRRPFDSVQEAMNVAVVGDKVVVLPGEYTENIDFKGKNFTLTSINPDNPSIVKATIIRAKVTTVPTIIASDGGILGFSIFGSTGIRVGQNVNYTSYSPNVSNCIINVSGIGIDIFVPYMHEIVYPLIENNIIEALTGVYFYVQSAAEGMNPIVRNNTIIGKGPSYVGSGIEYRTNKELPLVLNNVISNFRYGIELSYHNNLESQRISLIKYNNLFNNVYNYSFSYGVNSFDLTGIQGNIQADPCFADPQNSDYHLLPDSPCINAGDPDYMPEPNETDLDGKPRVMDGRIDIGAYECQSITKSNTMPVAEAGQNDAAYAWIDGFAEVTLNGSGSYDEDGDELTYFWTWSIGGETYDTSGIDPTIELPVGQHVISLTVNDGFEDSEPNEVVITVIEPKEGTMEVTPRTINGRKAPKKITATISLPADITAERIDTGMKLLLYPGEIEAASQNIQQRGRQGIAVIAEFDNPELTNAVDENGEVHVNVVGQLTTGQYFFGSDTIRIIGR